MTFCHGLKLPAPNGKMRQNAQGFGENKTASRKGGRIAGEAREKLEKLEKETGAKVVSSENYLTEPEHRKRLKTNLGEDGTP